MLKNTEEYFKKITQNKYKKLETTYEKNKSLLLAISSEDNSSKNVSVMSKGTAMQLYLALRVSSYIEFIKNRESLPFVTDDILETFDDDRSAETFEILKELSKKGQVIYMTHRKRVFKTIY